MATSIRTNLVSACAQDGVEEVEDYVATVVRKAHVRIPQLVKRIEGQLGQGGVGGRYV